MILDREHRKFQLVALAGALVMVMSSDPTLAGVKDTSAEEATCKEIGFLPKTASFADCVLELLSRKEAGGKAVASTVGPVASRQKPPTTGQAATAAPVAPPKPRAAPPTRPTPIPTPQYSETDPDALTCQRYGYSRGKPGFADCMMQIDMARQAQVRADADYANQMAAYQQQQAAAEQKAREDRELRQLQMIFGIMAGVGPRGSAQPAPYAAPPPPPNTNHTFRLPNGNQVYCSTSGGYTSCR